MEDSEKIVLRNMVFWGQVGAAEWEREASTRIEVDVEINTDLRKACKSDGLDDTIDYTELYDLIGKIVGGRHHNLLESLAEEVAGAALGMCDCGNVAVRVRKPHPPIGGSCDAAEVEVVRNKTSCK